MDFDSNDRFFLDGERLVCVKGEYGADGSEYRTEIDSFARITAIGAGPAFWKMETKAGLTVLLGQTPDSRTQVPQGILSWGVNRVQDSVTNYYDVVYARDTAAGQPFDFINDRIAAVHYTGNSKKNLAPYCHVYFDYEIRPDTSRAYSTYAGYRVTKRLSKIRVMTDGYTNHSYGLSYQASFQSGRSLLSSVTKMMEDNPTFSVPATMFTYDGLQNGEAIWKDPGLPKLTIYSSGVDGGDPLTSKVTTEDERKTIRLSGDVARAYLLPEGTTVYPDSHLQFEFKSSKMSLGAIIGFDGDSGYYMHRRSIENKDWSGLFRIGGSGDFQLAPTITEGSGRGARSYRPIYFGTYEPYTPNQGWKTVTLNVGAYAGNGSKYLTLICGDNNPNDAPDEAIFKNLRLYRSGSQQPSSVTPLIFDLGFERPTDSLYLGKPNGVATLDLNGDGLLDLVDWMATVYQASGGFVSPATAGQAYLGSPYSFIADNSHLPPTFLPLAIRPGSANVEALNKRHDLVAKPMDVDGDGDLDLMGSVNIVCPGYNISNTFAFYTWNGVSWVNKSGWELPFRYENIASAEPYGGKRRAHHFQWVDLNQDGYQDLTIRLTPYGKLVDPATNAVISGPNTSVAYLNKGANGPGWILDSTYALPEILIDGNGIDFKDIGRRLLDLDGDGMVEIAESYLTGASQVRHTYFQNGSGANRWNSTPGLANPPVSTYDFPVALVDATGVDEHGVVIFDCNGDGLQDLVQNVRGAGFGGPMINTWMNHGRRGFSPWMKDSGYSSESYIVPLPLFYPYSWNIPEQPRIPYGYEIADINGDGLNDILYSNEGAGNNLVIANTGSGWTRRDAWGVPGGELICYNDSHREQGLRGAKLQDVNSDGFPDMITGVSAPTQRVWFNQCRPEVLVGVTDGFGSQLGIEYRRLNDPTVATTAFGKRVYEKGTGPLPAGHARIIDSRLVVSRYSEPDGMGGRRYKSQRYGDLRYDRFNDASLGFGWVEAIDELNGQWTRMDASRTYPFAGSPVMSETRVKVTPEHVGSGSIYPGVSPGMKTVTLESSFYDELPPRSGIGGVVRIPVQTLSVKHTFDLNGTLKMETKTTQQLKDFDAYGFVKVSEVESLDGTKVISTNEYAHVVDNDRWHLGRLRQSVVHKLKGAGSSSAGPAEIVKTASFDYDPDSGFYRPSACSPGIRCPRRKRMNVMITETSCGRR